MVQIYVELFHYIELSNALAFVVPGTIRGVSANQPALTKPRQRCSYAQMPRRGEQRRVHAVPRVQAGGHRASIGTRDLRKWLSRVGLSYHSPHKFRHGHAVYALKMAKDVSALKAVSQNLMHENLTITEGVYGILSDNEVRKQIIALSNKISSGDVYRAAGPVSFRAKAKELRLWAEKNTTGYVLDAIRKLCAKTARFVLAYNHPRAHHTSNMLDRHMNPMAR
jgi:hypothetical protein